MWSTITQNIYDQCSHLQSWHMDENCFSNGKAINVLKTKKVYKNYLVNMVKLNFVLPDFLNILQYCVMISYLKFMYFHKIIVYNKSYFRYYEYFFVVVKIQYFCSSQRKPTYLTCNEGCLFYPRYAHLRAVFELSKYKIQFISSLETHSDCLHVCEACWLQKQVLANSHVNEILHLQMSKFRFQLIKSYMCNQILISFITYFYQIWKNEFKAFDYNWLSHTIADIYLKVYR